MPGSTSAIERAKAALVNRFDGKADAQGYVERSEQNLIAGIRMDQCESDLRHGKGNELHTKFRALHSSSALAVNSFGRFKDTGEDLTIFGQRGASGISFEKRLPIVPDRYPANLDVWIEQGKRIVAVESKLLEYFKTQKAEFAGAYERLAPPKSEKGWWEAFRIAKAGERQYLDRAQLIKHYFGLKRYQIEHGRGAEITLLYLFWEPLNWNEIKECLKHREQIAEFGKIVSESSISFTWMTYSDLWREWDKVPALTDHVRNLRARYEVSL